MAYDKEKDVVLKEKKVFDTDDYLVQLCQYDGGEKKISIVKKIVTKHGETFTSKVGRITLPYAKQIAKAMVEILKEEQ